MQHFGRLFLIFCCFVCYVLDALESYNDVGAYRLDENYNTNDGYDFHDEMAQFHTNTMTKRDKRHFIQCADGTKVYVGTMFKSKTSSIKFEGIWKLASIVSRLTAGTRLAKMERFRKGSKGMMKKILLLKDYEFEQHFCAAPGKAMRRASGKATRRAAETGKKVKPRKKTGKKVKKLIASKGAKPGIKESGPLPSKWWQAERWKRQEEHIPTASFNDGINGIMVELNDAPELNAFVVNLNDRFLVRNGVDEELWTFNGFNEDLEAEITKVDGGEHLTLNQDRFNQRFFKKGTVCIHMGPVGVSQADRAALLKKHETIYKKDAEYREDIAEQAEPEYKMVPALELISGSTSSGTSSVSSSGSWLAKEMARMNGGNVYEDAGQLSPDELRRQYMAMPPLPNDDEDDEVDTKRQFRFDNFGVKYGVGLGFGIETPDTLIHHPFEAWSVYDFIVMVSDKEKMRYFQHMKYEFHEYSDPTFKSLYQGSGHTTLLNDAEYIQYRNGDKIVHFAGTFHTDKVGHIYGWTTQSGHFHPSDEYVGIFGMFWGLNQKGIKFNSEDNELYSSLSSLSSSGSSSSAHSTINNIYSASTDNSDLDDVVQRNYIVYIVYIITASVTLFFVCICFMLFGVTCWMFGYGTATLQNKYKANNKDMIIEMMSD